MKKDQSSEVLTAVIVDDERLARKEMISLLQEHPEISVVGQADDAESALAEIMKHDPDVLFLDIQMPRKSGFDLLNEIDFRGKIIFVTAFDEYAIKAFEVNALDYLLKPVSAERLARALERLHQDQEHQDLPTKKLGYEDCLFLGFGTKLKFLKINQITTITADGDYTMAHLIDGNKGLTCKSMKEWEERLPEKHFSRIHRSTIINVGMIIRVEKWFNNSMRLQMQGYPDPVIISRRYIKVLKELYG